MKNFTSEELHKINGEQLNGEKEKLCREYNVMNVIVMNLQPTIIIFGKIIMEEFYENNSQTDFCEEACQGNLL